MFFYATTPQLYLELSYKSSFTVNSSLVMAAMSITQLDALHDPHSFSDDQLRALALARTTPGAPQVVSVTGDGLTGNAALCLGFYELEAGFQVNRRPVWRHASGIDRFLSFDSAGETEYCDGTTWHLESSLTCVEATLPPVPRVIELTGEGITGNAAHCLGLYQLEAGDEVNGRPVWRHAAGRDRLLAFDSSACNWRVQDEANLGSNMCFMHPANAMLYPSDARSGSWSWYDGNTWKSEPSIACVELRALDALGHHPQPPRPIELTGLLSSVRLVRARRWAEARSMLSDCQPLVDAVTAVSDGVAENLLQRGTSGVGVWCGTGQSSLYALKQVLRSCCEEVASKAKVLREKQHIVSVVASPATTSVASLGDDGEARLKDAVADRDAARCAYADAISSHLNTVRSARTLGELRDYAAKATASAASLVSKLTHARRVAAQKRFTLGGAAIREEMAILWSGGVDELKNREACDFIESALGHVATYKAATDGLPAQSQATDATARALQSALQGQWLEPESAADEAIVGRCLRSLAERVEVERRHWDALSHPFPYATLLQAGAIASTVRGLEAQALRSTLEKYEELQAELEKEMALINTKVDEIEMTLQQARDKVEEASLDLEEEGTKLKRARRQSGALCSPR